MDSSRATRQPTEADLPRATERLEETFARCQNELFGTLYYVVGNAEDARDAVQETFVKCWRHRQEVPEIENLRAWIFRIAINTGRDLRSTAWRRRRVPLEKGDATLEVTQSEPETGDPQTEASRREELALVRQAVLHLRPEEQEVFLLRQNGEMTYDQIAASMKIPVGTVKTRMRLAITKLRGALEGK